MKLRNAFSQETRNEFLYVYWCFSCKRSDRGLSLHHISGRDSNSKYNACPLCDYCHGHIGHSKEEEERLKEIVKKYLNAINNTKGKLLCQLIKNID